MASNYVVKDANGATVTFRSTDDGSTNQIPNVRLTDATAAGFALLGSAANIAGSNPGTGTLQVSQPGMWSVNHTPATATQATASKSAGAAGVRHVATSISFCYSAGASAITAAAPLLVNLRDGATGAGTILWSSYVNVPATAAQSVVLTLGGLNVFGSAATAMTLEFSAAGGTNSYQSVSLTGYDTV